MNIRDNKIIATLYYAMAACHQRCSYTCGHKNKVKANGVRVSSRIQIDGNNNLVEICKGGKIINTTIHICGNNNSIIIHKGTLISGAELWIENNNCKIELMESTFIGHNTHIACTENGNSIIIEKDSMISSHVQIRTGDSHSILNAEGQRINPAAPVHIGEHCWIGEGAKILKGVTLGKNSMVATGAIVTKSFQGNNIIGGVPAIILKKNIKWESKRI